MNQILLFLLSIYASAQINDTIKLESFYLQDYSKYEQFRPTYKKIVSLTDHTSYGIKLFSTLHLPNEKVIEIVAIEFLFESEPNQVNYCNENYFFRPILLTSKFAKESLIKENWFEVNKDYKGRYIFPINLPLSPKDAKEYIIGYETSYPNIFCPEANGYFDLINTKSKSIIYYSENDQLSEEIVLKNHAINYKIYYKVLSPK